MACHCAVVARYSGVPWRRAKLRRSSREIVHGGRSSWRAMARTPRPCARKMAISSRSRMKDSALIEFSMTARNALEACPQPSGTSVLRQPATALARPQRYRWSAPRQPPTRTVYSSPAAPLEAGLATPKMPPYIDPNRACISSSQPPILGCCDDRLNRPWNRPVKPGDDDITSDTASLATATSLNASSPRSISSRRHRSSARLPGNRRPHRPLPRLPCRQNSSTAPPGRHWR